MKKLLVFVLAVMLASPAYAMGGWFSKGPSLESVIAFVDSVQKTAVQACGFLPYASSIAVIYVSNPVVPVALEFANKICAKAQAPDTMAMKHGLPTGITVDGAKVEGQFVGKEGK